MPLAYVFVFRRLWRKQRKSLTGTILFNLPKQTHLVKLQKTAGLAALLSTMLSTGTTALGQTKGELAEHQQYLIRSQEKKDSLKFILKRRFIIGFQAGSFIMPGYAAGKEDNVTGVDLRKKKPVLGLSVEYYYSSRLSLGAELNFQGTERRIDNMANGFSEGGGMVIPIYLFTKYFITNPVVRPYIKPGLKDLNPLAQDVEGSLAEQNSINNIEMRRPRVYLLAGAGLVNTLLVKINGSMVNGSDPAVNAYRQTVPSGEVGVGIFSRIDKLISLDLAGKYILSTNYSPSIGGVRAYEGFKIEMRIGFIGNSGINSLKHKL